MSVKETLAITQRNSLIHTYIGSDLIWRALTGESGRNDPKQTSHKPDRMELIDHVIPIAHVKEISLTNFFPSRLGLGDQL